MDQMEKTFVARTKRYNQFPSTPAQEGKSSVSEAVLAVPRVETPAAKRIWFFEEGSGEMKDVLGRKGADLAEMTPARLPVPPGVPITAQPCLAHDEARRPLPDGLPAESAAPMEL